MAELTPSDALALTNNDGFGGGNSFMWIFALLILMFGGAGWGMNRGPMGPGPDMVTHAELTAGLNNVQTQQQLQQIALSSANNNYETAQLVNNQTNLLLQQNNANLINAIQGFNTVNQNISAQANNTNMLLQQLGAKMDTCCCEIKTQALQNRLDAAERRNVELQNTIVNANQSQYLLGQLGRFVAWTAEGTNGGAAATA